MSTQTSACAKASAQEYSGEQHDTSEWMGEDMNAWTVIEVNKWGWGAFGPMSHTYHFPRKFHTRTFLAASTLITNRNTHGVIFERWGYVTAHDSHRNKLSQTIASKLYNSPFAHPLTNPRIHIVSDYPTAKFGGKSALISSKSTGDRLPLNCKETG